MIIRGQTSKRWAVVLAGGEGERMRPLIERWTGSQRPKQYCAFTGQRTMLEHTLDRARDIASPECIVTVIGPGHERYLRSPKPIYVPGLILEQPARRGTAPAVFFPLTHVLSQDPEALVAIFPSDHFIHPRERFREFMQDAFGLAEQLPGQLVLVSSRPDRIETEYGWIKPGARFKHGNVFLVDQFVEKPEQARASELFSQGSLWNTMIVVAKVATLWDLAWGLMPSMMSRFAALQSRIGTRRESQAVADAHEGMDSSDFVRDFLEHLVDWTLTMPLTDIAWSDWGRPERVMETLQKFGRTPLFQQKSEPKIAEKASVSGQIFQAA